MKSIVSFATLFFFAASAFADTETVSFDNTYDNSAGSLNTVSCSDGPNGLVGRFPTFGQLPSFPNIGGSQAVAGFGSPNCGSCWALTFEGVTINVTAIDHAAAGFNIAEAALNTLTKGQAAFLGRINASVTQLPASSCGL
ncbi:hypothetical protein K439DRAFT_1639737 [Ramaria rubella]|nr:hypothetical protein K439DRAFT_1639737 [Ramaria rubella]